MRRTWKAKYTRSSKNRWLQHTLQFIFDTIIRSTFPGKDCTRHFVVSVLHHCVICHLSYKSYKRVVSWFDPKWLSNIGNVRNAINLFFWKERGLPHAFLHTSALALTHYYTLFIIYPPPLSTNPLSLLKNHNFFMLCFRLADCTLIESNR